jgi:autotransporter-associated beta strand protein
VSEDTSVLGVDLRSAGWHIGGSGTILGVGTGGVDSAGAGASTIDPMVAANAQSTWTVGTGNALNLAGGLYTNGQTVTKDGAGTLTVSGLQSHLEGSTLNVTAGTVELASDAGGDGANLAVNVTSSATLDLQGNQGLKSLSLTGNSKVKLSGGGVLVLSGLTIAGIAPPSAPSPAGATAALPPAPAQAPGALSAPVAASPAPAAPLAETIVAEDDALPAILPPANGPQAPALVDGQASGLAATPAVRSAARSESPLLDRSAPADAARAARVPSSAAPETAAAESGPAAGSPDLSEGFVDVLLLVQGQVLPGA